MAEDDVVEAVAASPDVQSGDDTEFRVSLPWKVIEGPEFYTVHDPVLKEVCRIPKTVPSAKQVGLVLAAMPWMMTAMYRLIQDFDQAIERKDGTTLRQWLRNHEGAQRREELEHALRVALDPEAAEHPPRSYGLKLGSPRPDIVPKKDVVKSFREMLEEGDK